MSPGVDHEAVCHSVRATPPPHPVTMSLFARSNKAMRKEKETLGGSLTVSSVPATEAFHRCESAEDEQRSGHSPLLSCGRCHREGWALMSDAKNKLLLPQQQQHGLNACPHKNQIHQMTPCNSCARHDTCRDRPAAHYQHYLTRNIQLVHGLFDLHWGWSDRTGAGLLWWLLFKPSLRDWR